MTHLEIFKTALNEIGAPFLEETINAYTYIVMVNPNDAPRNIDLQQDKFFEFDEAGELASYP